MHTNVPILQTTGWPAIFFAAKNGKVSTLRKLLEWGARTELEVRDTERGIEYQCMDEIDVTLYVDWPKASRCSKLLQEERNC